MAVARGDIDALRTQLSGRVIERDDPDFDLIRAALVWNGAIDRRPWAIVQAANAADVAAALRFALEHGREVSVRGGGHGFSGACIADDCVMIDLGPMRHVSVDPGAHRASCGGGTRWAELDEACQAFGLAVPGGFISHTGVAGLTLGGGMGWLSRRFGLSCDNLIGAEMVTAEGAVIEASDEQHPELFWALRGGGGNFGVVTRFDFRTHQVGPEIDLALTLWDLEQGPAALRAAREMVDALPDEVAMFITAMSAPPAPFVPEALHGALCFAVVLVGHGGGDEARAAAALRAEAAPMVAFDTPMPYVGLQRMFDESAPWGIFGYEKALYLDDLPDPAIDAVARRMPEKASPMTFMPTFVLGGDFARHAEDATAFGGRRSVRYVLNLAAIAPTPDLLDADRAWARELWGELRPYADGAGSYINFMSEYEPDRIEAAFGADKLRRLREVKRAYDPGNVFHLNANIAPLPA